MNRLYDACRSQFRSVRVIYEDIAQGFPNAVISVSFDSISNDLYRWQRLGQAELPIPTTLSEFNIIIHSVEFFPFTMHDSGRVSVRSTSHGEEASTSVVFGDLDFINGLGVIDNLHFVTTSSKVPGTLTNMNACEVMTVVVNYNNYAFPILWVLIPNRLRRTYDFIMDKISTFFGINNNPIEICTDFERRLHGSLTVSFPETTVQTTYHSYCWALLMEAEMRGLLPFNIDVKIIFKKLIALSCLPAEDIPAMFVEIKNSASPAVQATLREFFDYFENAWINGVTPRLFSFYEKLEVMTDCGVTGQVSLCQSLSIDGNIWAFTLYNFTEQILKISNQSTKDFGRMQRQRRINVTPRVRLVIKRDKMERAWKMFATQKITLSRLFQLATVLVSEHVEMLLYRNDFTLVDCELLSPNEMANDAEFEGIS
ncbi:hypothetical protein KQX54_012082 [Cotesia glomerata]|uniref:MULE transposase domain-containing protein n=1 Tax=Cotesia glomerata TaxID=32391 RepID=A0AAV7HV56_COTGL|nr:hypothetical protein KQX54_012082 [Cotesia glomerata]